MSVRAIPFLLGTMTAALALAGAQRPGGVAMDANLQRLAVFVGTWSQTCRNLPGPFAAEEQACSGSSTYRWIAGGQWLAYDSVIETPGRGTYEVHGVLSYDPARRQYTAFAFNNLAPRGMEYTGEWTDGHTLAFKGVGKTARGATARVIYAMQTDGRIRFSSEESKADGLFAPYFESVLTRMR